MKQYINYLAVFTLFLFSHLQAVASADGLKKLIASYEENSKNLTNVAQQLAGGFVHIGTSFNLVDWEQHQCHALALAFGKMATAQKAAVMYRINTVTRSIENAHDVAVAAHSMHVFTLAATEVGRWSSKQREEEWNLGCAGRFGISNNERFQGPQASFFQLRANGRALVVLGNVEAGFYSKIKHALDNNPKITTVLLGSDGGAVFEAIDAGRYIRQKGLNTELWNSCRSACVLVFLGGVERRIDAPYPALGFHQISIRETAGRSVAVPATDSSYQRVAMYATEMGVSAPSLIGLMRSKPPDDMLDIKYDHSDQAQILCKFRIATVVQRGCSADDFLRGTAREQNPDRKPNRNINSRLMNDPFDYGGYANDPFDAGGYANDPFRGGTYNPYRKSKE